MYQSLNGKPADMGGGSTPVSLCQVSGFGLLDAHERQLLLQGGHLLLQGLCLAALLVPAMESPHLTLVTSRLAARMLLAHNKTECQLLGVLYV